MFHGWEGFYTLIGTAAGGLIGLFFLVATLTQARDRAQALRAGSIYLTPTLLNFAVVMANSAVALAPPMSAQLTAALLAIGALAGLGNALWACVGIDGWNSGTPTAPHWTDFWLYGLAPAGLNAALLAGDAALWNGTPWAAEWIGVVMLALLLLGVRNAWDLVTWMAPRGRDE